MHIYIYRKARDSVLEGNVKDNEGTGKRRKVVIAGFLLHMFRVHFCSGFGPSSKLHGKDSYVAFSCKS